MVFSRSTKFSSDVTRGKEKLDADADRIEKLIIGR